MFCELVWQRLPHYAVIQILEELEVFFSEGGKAIFLRCVFLQKMWYNIILDLFLLIKEKFLIFFAFNLNLSLHQLTKKGLETITNTDSG